MFSCFSAIGRQGYGQTISIGNGFESLGVILHEILHTFGFDHTHTRFDRDDHLYIYFNNIKLHLLGTFKKVEKNKSNFWRI